MAELPVPPDIAKMNFEEALAELEAIVRRLETAEGSLEDSIAAYQRGTDLKRHCEAKLKDAQARIDKIVAGPDGAIATEPMKAD